MTRPDSLFEAASYDLNKFIERRITERRAIQREALDRRQLPILQNLGQDATTSTSVSSEESSASH